MLKIIGNFLFVFGLVMIWERRQRTKGIKTWEYKHGIEFKRWHVILCIVLGVILTFAGSLLSNMREFIVF